MTQTFSEKIKDYLKDYKNNQQEVSNFTRWVNNFIKEPKNSWAKTLTEDMWWELFKKVANEWLWFDWKHITYQKTGISYDYVAYKNRMLIAYPESIIDINIVYEWDEFEFKKSDWKINYSHKFTDPFSQKDETIKWWYCIIKNDRWEFITLLSKADFEKHRKVAKTDYIWKQWYKEMCLKTLFKKATKAHYDDIFTTMEEEDNKHYDINKQIDIESKEMEEGLKNKYNQDANI